MKELKTVVASALKVAVEKGILLAEQEPELLATIVDMGVSNVSTIHKVGSGELTTEEGLNEIEENTIATVTVASEVVRNKCKLVGTQIGAKIGSIFGPKGAAVGGFVGGVIGGIVGSETGQAIIKGAKKVVNVVKNGIKSVVKGVGNFVKNVGRGIANFFGF